MNDIEVSSIDLVEGGNVFKQGHYLTLGYVPRDEKGETVDLSGKTLNVSLWGRKGVVFEAAATYSGGVIRFTFDKLVAAGDYTVEFTATSSTDAKYRKKFPTNQHSGRIAIKQSADDLGVVGIQVYTVAQLKAEQKALLDVAVSGFTMDSETKMARVSGSTTYTSLPARLEADKQATAAQLAETSETLNKRLDEKIIESGAANAQVTDALVSTEKNKTFSTIRNRLEEGERDLSATKKDTTIYPMKNLLPNSDFSDGIKGWVAAGSTGTTTAAAGVLTHTVSTPSTSTRLQVEEVKPVPGHVYYARIDLKPSHLVNTSRYHFGDSQVAFYDLPANVWSKRTAILKPTTNTIEYRIFVSTYTAGDSVSYRAPLLIDLTAIFGAGNEPDLAEMDSIFSGFSTGWFKNERAMVSVQDFYVEFSQFKKGIENDIPSENPNPQPVPSSKNFYFVPENIPDVYNASSNETFAKFESVIAYQAALSALAVDYPEYVTETFHGNDSSGTYPIYSYKLIPQQPQANNVTKKLPKLIVICGLHGSENTSVYSMYYLMKELCENWKNSPALEYLRWSTELVFMPNANPYGFENFQRVNANGVDINRNFPTNWRLGTVGDQTYGGPSAASEVETQYVISLLEEHKDAVYMADYHTNGSSGSDYGMLMWHSLLSMAYEIPELDQASRFFIGKMSRKFIKEYGQPDNVGDFGYVSYSNLNGCGKLYAQSIGLNASTIESFMKFPTESENFTPTTNKACTEYAGNWLLTVSQFYKERYYQ